MTDNHEAAFAAANPTCGQCIWRKPFDNSADAEFVCNANPPAMIFDPDGELISVRTVVDADDNACRHFRGAH